jgi:DNA (cytosine-5)-methyltransferase 1
MGVVLGDLAALGYDAEWECIPASAIGAPHDRDRVWIVADADEKRVGEFTRRQCYPDLERHISEIARGRVSRTPWVEATGLPGSPADLVRDATSYRVDDGLSERVDACGNAVVPQIPEIIGRAIMRVA